MLLRFAAVGYEAVGEGVGGGGGVGGGRGGVRWSLDAVERVGCRWLGVFQRALLAAFVGQLGLKSRCER